MDNIAALMVVPRLSGVITHVSLAVLLLCASIFTASGLLLTPEGISFEVADLMNIKASLNDPDGALRTWDIFSVDPCGWALVICSSQDVVVSLEAPSKNLSGQLSPSIGNLTNLVTLRLEGNNISGNIPPEIGKLSSLKALDLSSNNFNGGIPASLERLKNLQYLDLSYNNLSGPLPPWFVKRKYNIAGNPLICGTNSQEDCFGRQSVTMANRTYTAQSNSQYRNFNPFLHFYIFVLIACDAYF